MTVQRIISESRCKCSKPEIYLQTDYPFDFHHLELLFQYGYRENPRYRKLGILFAHNDDLILKGSFGSNRLKITYKKANVSASLDRLETILEGLDVEKFQTDSKEKEER